jgi:hypothetical protein
MHKYVPSSPWGDGAGSGACRLRVVRPGPVALPCRLPRHPGRVGEREVADAVSLPDLKGQIK